MTKAVWTFAISAILLAAALTGLFLRGEDTRDQLRVIQRGPAVECVKGDQAACRQLLRALMAADGRRPDRGGNSSKVAPGHTLRDLSPGGGGAFGSPTGGGPIGRVPSPGDSPPADQPSPSPPPAPSEPLIDLDAPLVPRTCVGDLLAVNCP